ncbi:MAG TPA: gamma-glutamyl-gamma-aminobutyrate hydrolase family protein [Dehalococcoidia bacterium]|nr:gamma-glutamyl-gamma-aminobutyrate hydrolase family protein [Dehalococcoidia bacterium]
MTLPRVAVARWTDVPIERLTRYWDALRNAGIEPVDYGEPGRSLKDCAGLLLTGGIDIDPARYGEARHPSVDEVSPGRDTHEAGLLWQALESDKPVLAICRGHQLLNVCLGGKLLQDIESGAHRWLEQEGYPSQFHEVAIEPETKLGHALGEGKTTVNSRHHQAVTLDRLAPGLRVSALSDDGLIEGVESERHTWVVGVQWHPERVEENEAFNESSRRLFAAFAYALQSSKLPPG